jgi:hypothetical protein
VAEVAKAPPLTAARKAQLSTLLRMSDIDKIAMERKAGLKKLIEPHPPLTLRCGRHNLVTTSN